MKVPCAYWTNGLGEDCSSQVHATFQTEEGTMIVVKNWRRQFSGDRTPYEVRAESECEVRYEDLD